MTAGATTACARNSRRLWSAPAERNDVGALDPIADFIINNNPMSGYRWVYKQYGSQAKTKAPVPAALCRRTPNQFNFQLIGFG